MFMPAIKVPWYKRLWWRIFKCHPVKPFDITLSQINEYGKIPSIYGVEVINGAAHSIDDIVQDCSMTKACKDME